MPVGRDWFFFNKEGVEGGDRGLLILFLVLGLLGLMMVYSASAAGAWKEYADSTYFLKKQILWSAAGLYLFFLLAQSNYNRLRETLAPLLGVVTLLLLVVLLFGRDVNGARRWIRFGPIGFQPSESAKLFAILYLSHYIAKKGSGFLGFLRMVGPPLLILGLLGSLIFVEPDLGTTLILVILTGLLLLIGGVSLRHLAWLSLLLVPLVTYSLVSFPYMLQRVKTYINPLTDPPHKSFQINQSYIALGSGGLFGEGLGEGRQKLFFLPQPHTDFIFSIIGEEFGMMGTFLIVILFLALLWKGVRMAQKQTEPFAQMLTVGTTLVIVIPALINMGVVTGLLPTKGLALPFISYGGSSLLMNWAAAGILYRSSKEASRSHKDKSGYD